MCVLPEGIGSIIVKAMIKTIHKSRIHKKQIALVLKSILS